MTSLEDIVKQHKVESPSNIEMKRITPTEKKEEKKEEKKNSIVICLNRALTFEELVKLNKQFSVLQFKSEFHGDKSADKLIYQMLILDFHNKQHVSWYSQNKEYLKNHSFIINLALSKKKLKPDKIEKCKKIYGFDSIIKHITGDTPQQILANLLVDHLQIPQNGCLDGLFRFLQPSSKKK